MVVRCPFCKTDWVETVLRSDSHIDHELNFVVESCQCDCGAWWYEGMEDVEDD